MHNYDKNIGNQRRLSYHVTDNPNIINSNNIRDIYRDRGLDKSPNNNNYKYNSA